MQKLKGKVALITGGSDGLALASARIFVSEGAFVFVTGRNRERLDRAIAELGANAVGIQADSGSLPDLDGVFDQVQQTKGCLDVLFVNAAASEREPLGQITHKNVLRMLEVNVVGTIFTVQKALPLIRDGGSIILTGSIAASKGFPTASVYAATKAAVRSLCRTWAAELLPRKIRVNTLSPGPLDTAIVADIPPDAREAFAKQVPMGRFGQPDEIGPAALYLASDDSRFMTGSELCVDGGMAQL